MIVQAQQNDTVDALAYRHFGRTVSLVEAVLLRNPGLADHGPILPAGTPVELPDDPPAAPAEETVKLWE